MLILYGAVAQLARAPALQAGGQEFDSPQLHQKKLEILYTIISLFSCKMLSLGDNIQYIEKYIDEK